MNEAQSATLVVIDFVEVSLNDVRRVASLRTWYACVRFANRWAKVLKK